MNDNAMILSKNVQMPFDDDCMNKNIVVIGTPGSGKTYCYVKPNIINLGKAGQSMIISDTKGDLVKKYGVYLKNLGYEVLTIDLIDTSRSLGYNPMLHIENDRDVLTFAHTLVPDDSMIREPYWDNMARFFIEALTAYVCLEKTDREKQIQSLIDLFKLESYQKPKRSPEGIELPPEPSELCKLFKELEDYSPNSFAVEIYKMYEKVKGSDITDSSILSSVSEKLMPFVTKAVGRIINRNDVDLKSIGDRKTAVFLVISDNDRSLDKIVNLFYAQAINSLIRHADNDTEEGRLKVPVSLLIDDFGAQTVIDDFDNIIATCRSRNISVSIMIQSISQLRTAYGKKADTIIACCDTQLYFGGSDLETIAYTSRRTGESEYDIMNMPRYKVWVMQRCKAPKLDAAFDLREHPDCALTGEFDLSLRYDRSVIEYCDDDGDDINDCYMLSFSNRISQLKFRSTMKSILEKELGFQLRPCYSGSYNKDICYSQVFEYGDRYILCLFEDRKRPFDEFYSRSMIDPIKKELLKIYGKFYEIVLVSFGGFVREEINYSAERDILLVDRNGFNRKRFGKRSIFVNRKDIEAYRGQTIEDNLRQHRTTNGLRLCMPYA